MLLHEGLGCVALWRDFPEALAEATGCGVFAYSRFGYGGSDPVTLPRPMHYMHDEALDVLPRVLDAAGMRRAVLIGHSDGGSIAAIYAGAVRDPRVTGAVLIAAHFFVEDINIAAIRAIKATYRAGRSAPSAGAISSRRGRGIPRLERRVARLAVPRIRHHRAGRAHPGADPGAARRRRPVWHRGAASRAGAHATCPVETRLIAGARHSPHLEAKQPTLDAVVPFVRSVLMEATA